MKNFRACKHQAEGTILPEHYPIAIAWFWYARGFEKNSSEKKSP